MTEPNHRAPRRASMREVADLAQVAISSVSRVLSGHPDVSAPMRARVLDAVARLEYEPDFLAQSLRRGQTLSVGFVLADISNPLIAEIVLGAEAVLRAAGYSLILMNSESRAALDAAHIRFFQSRRVDGLMLSLADEASPATLEALGQGRQPAVVVDRELPAALGVSAVVNDHGAGMRAAVSHLVSLGHRRIGLIGGPLGTLPARERLEAMKAVIAASDGVEGRYLSGPFSSEHGREATRQLLRGAEPPTAIVAGGNQLLIGALEALQEADLEVGRQISIVTCDDVPLSRLYRPPIASISRDTVGLGRTAAELLLRRMGDDPGPPERVVLPTTFVARASCAPPPGAAPVEHARTGPVEGRR
ncbi:MAG TPA: LacI family DNA-binding transcriptional regulator [Candidatus Limnocylindrales bacterium]|nr:LacI family DNA-binding transcriptional regulator [Candidatus Limnocylindrales bacterium]